MTTKEKIEVMQAYLDGKQIQTRRLRRDKGGWADWPNEGEPVWDFWSCEYRIKPEPRIPIEGWAVLYTTGSRAMTCVFGTRSEAEGVLLACGGVGSRVVHFREVIEDEESPSES